MDKIEFNTISRKMDQILGLLIKKPNVHKEGRRTSKKTMLKDKKYVNCTFQVDKEVYESFVIYARQHKVYIHVLVSQLMSEMVALNKKK